MSQSPLTAEHLSQWERERSIQLPPALLSIYQEQDGGFWPGTNFEFVPLKDICTITEFYGEEEVEEWLESHEDQGLTTEDVTKLFYLGSSNYGDPVFIRLDDSPQGLFSILDMELVPKSDNAQEYFTQLMTFDPDPLVKWDALGELQIFGGENFQLPSGAIENHLGQGAEGSLVLFYRALSPDLDIQESLTHAVLTNLDPDQCMITQSPAGFMLQLCGEVLEKRSERGEKGWKNFTETGTSLSFHSSGRDLLETIRRKLVSADKCAEFQAAEDTQSKLMEQFSVLDPSEHEAAGAAMASSVLREAMKMLEPEEGEQDEMTAKIMGGLLSGIEKMVQGLDEKVEAGDLSEKSTEALGDLMKDMIPED